MLRAVAGPLMEASEVARWLGKSEATVYRLAAAGVVPAQRQGRRWRFQRAEVEGWLRGVEQGGARGVAQSVAQAIELGEGEYEITLRIKVRRV